MTKTIPELWVERQLLHAENQRWLSEEPQARDAAEYSEWERRGVFAKLIAVERLISDTPAASIDDALTKVRIAGYWFELEHAPFGELCEESSISDEERMTLSAYQDIKRLCNGPPDPRESREAVE